MNCVHSDGAETRTQIQIFSPIKNGHDSLVNVWKDCSETSYRYLRPWSLGVMCMFVCGGGRGPSVIMSLSLLFTFIKMVVVVLVVGLGMSSWYVSLSL